MMFTEGKNCVIVVKRGGPSPHSSRGAAALRGLGHSKASNRLGEKPKSQSESRKAYFMFSTRASQPT